MSLLSPAPQRPKKVHEQRCQVTQNPDCFEFWTASPFREMFINRVGYCSARQVGVLTARHHRNSIQAHVSYIPTSPGMLRSTQAQQFRGNACAFNSLRCLLTQISGEQKRSGSPPRAESMLDP